MQQFVNLFLQNVSLRSRKRTFSERYLRVIKLRNFESIRRSRNEASMPRCIIPICECVSVRVLRICHYIIRDWRGLAELLISMERQCEGLIWWDKQESFSHVFFVSITVVLTLMPKQGEWLANKCNYGK